MSNRAIQVALLGFLLSCQALAQHGIKLTWTASTTSGIQNYSVWRSTTSGNGNCGWTSPAVTPCPYAEIATGVACCSYLDTAVTPGVTYYYVVADWAPAPTAATATATIGTAGSSNACPGALDCVTSVTLTSGGSGYNYGLSTGRANSPGFVFSGGGGTGAVFPTCTNWNGTAYQDSIYSCDQMDISGGGSGFAGSGFSSTPTVTATTGPLDMGQIYPAVPGSGISNAAFSNEVSMLDNSGPNAGVRLRELGVFPGLR